MATGGKEDSRSSNDTLKIGTVVPNRIFVGGISGNTNEEDLRCLFSKLGNVRATKIIFDKAGISKGFGFVTFETEEEAQKILNEVDSLKLKDRTLNIAPAVKKQPYSRTMESNSMHSAPVVWSYHQPYSSGSSQFTNRESVYYPQANWPVVWPQLYLPQQYHYPTLPQTGYPQYVYSVAPPDYPYPSGTVAGSDFSETSSADSGDSGKPRSKISSTPVTPDFERNRSQVKTSYHQNSRRCSNGNAESPPPSYAHSSPFQHLHHVLAKTVNGVTVMAYPSSFVMGSPTIVHVKENGEAEGMLTDLGFLPSQIATGSLTPPPTPLSSLSCDFSVNTSMESIRK